MTLVLEINSDFFNGALHRALLKRIYEKSLSGSAPNRLEARGLYATARI